MIDLILAISAAAAQAQAAPASDVVIRFSGSGRWDVTCDAQTDNGERRRLARGRGSSSFETLRFSDATAVACELTVAARGQMLMRFIEADAFACPFGAELDMDDCQRTIYGPAQRAVTVSPASQ